MFWLKVILVLNQHLNYFLPRTEKPKIVFLKRHKGATPSFFEPHRGTRGYLIPCDESPVYCFQFCYPSLLESALSKTFAQRFPPKASQINVATDSSRAVSYVRFNYQPAAVYVHDGSCDSNAGHGCDRRLFLTVVSDGGVACRHT